MKQPTPIDFDLHGLIGIRVIGNADDAAVVARQVGLSETVLEREPDLSLRFVDRLDLDAGELRSLGADDAAFTDDAFVILRGRKKSASRVQVPFADVGGPCELVCERGLAAVPLLIPLLNLALLDKGVLALHASGFEHQGRGVVVTGWSKGGKTATLLAFAMHGAAYVGDAWIHLTADGESMYGIQEPIPVRPWHWRSLPQLRQHVRLGERARVWALELALTLVDGVTAHGARHGNALVRTFNRLAPALRRQLAVDLSPQQLFGPSRCLTRARPDTLLFVVSHARPEISVRPIDAAEVAARMVHALQEEQTELLSWYRRFRFAFPERVNQRIEGSAARQRELLDRSLAGKRAFEVRHPYPVSIDELFAVVRPCCE